MRVIKSNDVYDIIYENILNVNFFLEEKVLNKIKAARDLEEEKAKKRLDNIIKNCEIAGEKHLPLCQDTGMLEIFVRVGSDVFIDFSNSEQKNIYDFLNNISQKAYEDGYCRKSIVSALSRKNTKDNTPAVIHTEYIDGDTVEIYVVPKGFGCENMSSLKMFNPTATPDELVDFVVEKVNDAGPNPCPPIFLGIGIGGTSEKAVLLAKEAQFGLIHKVNSDEEKIVDYLKKEILRKSNNLNLGPFALGGLTTVFDVNINVFPTHIAGLPVAVTFSCWCNRYKKIVL